MNIFIASLLVGCIIAILGHKVTEERRAAMFERASAEHPDLEPNVVMTLVTISLSISIMVFVVVWPLVVIYRLFRSAT